MCEKSGLALSLLGLTLLIPAYQLMPEEWFNWVELIESYHSDESSQGRVDAWILAFNMATTRPLVSGGYAATYSQEMFDRYAEGWAARAAHSLYFEVLSEHGFIGLGLLLALVSVGWRSAPRAAVLDWAFDLATMLQTRVIPTSL